MKKAEKRLLKTVKSKKKHGADPNLLTITTNFLAFFQFFLQIVVLGMKIHFTTSLIFLLQIREDFYLKKIIQVPSTVPITVTTGTVEKSRVFSLFRFNASKR